MAHQDPTKEEYERLSVTNIRYFGHGVNTGMALPCPFCAAPEFASYKILEMELVMARGNVCKVCGRGMRAEFNRGPNHVLMHFIQTSGPDMPDYLKSVIRDERMKGN